MLANSKLVGLLPVKDLARLTNRELFISKIRADSVTFCLFDIKCKWCNKVVMISIFPPALFSAVKIVNCSTTFPKVRPP